MASRSSLLYRPQELAYRTQYAELKERARAAGGLLPGTPGSLVLRTGTGRGYWYRVYQSAAGQQTETLVGKEDDAEALAVAQGELDFARWTVEQVRSLRRLEFQVADKGVARVLVELHNKGLLAAGLTLMGTLGYMAWLNEYGARVVSARTQDIDLAARQHLKLAAPQSFLDVMEATQLGFTPVPGMPHTEASTSVKLRGSAGLRVDMLTHGKTLGVSVPLPQLMWHAQTVPFYDYLLAEPREAAVLAGGHCIPVLLPQPDRFVWHKLYSSAARHQDPTKAAKDLLQAATLAAVLVEQDDDTLSDSVSDMPAAMKKVLRQQLSAAHKHLIGHAATWQALELALS